MDGTDLLTKFINSVFVPLYQLFLGATFAYFLFGVMWYMWQMNNPDVRDKAREHLLWGGIGLFIMFSVGGLFKLFSGVFTGIFTF